MPKSVARVARCGASAPRKAAPQTQPRQELRSPRASEAGPRRTRS